MMKLDHKASNIFAIRYNPAADNGTSKLAACYLDLREKAKAIVDGYDKLESLVPPCLSTPMQALRDCLGG